MLLNEAQLFPATLPSGRGKKLLVHAGQNLSVDKSHLVSTP